MCEDVARTVHLARALGDARPARARATSTRSTTATRTSTASAEAADSACRPHAPHRPDRDHAGALRRHAARDHRAAGRAIARDVAAALEGVAECVVEPPARNRADVERVVREFEAAGVDGLLVVMLTYGPGHARRPRARPRRGCRSASPTSSPSPSVTAEWDMADMTYNQGVHGAQDTANAMVRAGAPFDVITEDWQSRRVPRRASSAGRAPPRAVTAGAALKVAHVRLRDGRHGRHPRRRGRAAALARPAASPTIAPGDLYRARRRRDAGRRSPRCIAYEDEHFEIDPRLSADRARGPRAHAGRARAAPRGARLRRVLDPLRRDRRRRALRAPPVGRRVDPDGEGVRLRAARATR